MVHAGRSRGDDYIGGLPNQPNTLIAVDRFHDYSIIESGSGSELETSVDRTGAECQRKSAYWAFRTT